MLIGTFAGFGIMVVGLTGMGALGPRLVRSLFGSREEHERRINAQCLAEGHGAHVLMAADFLDLRCMGVGFHPSNTDRRVLTTPRLARTFIDGPGPTPWVNPDFNSKPKV